MEWGGLCPDVPGDRPGPGTDYGPRRPHSVLWDFLVCFFFFALLGGDRVCEPRVTRECFHHRHGDAFLLGCGDSFSGRDIEFLADGAAPHTGSPEGCSCQFTEDSGLETVRGARTPLSRDTSD